MRHNCCQTADMCKLITTCTVVQAVV